LNRIEQDISKTSLQLPFLADQKLKADVLRLDLVHPLVSGNKWFKLKEYLADAKRQQIKTILTFGGAYSNHILATAAACKEAGFESIGIIRGEEPAQLSPTLVQAKELAMQFLFVSREEYKRKTISAVIQQQYGTVYAVNEGGYGELGAKGASAILKNDGHAYTHILVAVGTGTTLAGLITASDPDQQCIGISALKNHLALIDEINALLPAEKQNKFTLLHDYHFGGYAKYTNELLQFMNDWYGNTGIPSDFVYTAKLFYAFSQLCQQHYFPPASNILLIHSGGLQGNRSLKSGTLIF
jgi:1-aminocyclopropane-1-carboxylate deaminase